MSNPHTTQVTRTADQKTYALKKVDVGSLDDKEMLSALNEIRLLASFSHPRIVRLYETFLGEWPLHMSTPRLGLPPIPCHAIHTGRGNRRTWIARGGEGRVVEIPSKLANP